MVVVDIFFLQLVCPGGAGGGRGSIKALERLWSPGACELLVIKALVGVADAVNH